MLFCGSIHWPCLSMIHLNWLIQIAYQMVYLEYMWSSRWTEINSYQWKQATFDMKYEFVFTCNSNHISANIPLIFKSPSFLSISRPMCGQDGTVVTLKLSPCRKWCYWSNSMFNLKSLLTCKSFLLIHFATFAATKPLFLFQNPNFKTCQGMLSEMAYTSWIWMDESLNSEFEW